MKLSLYLPVKPLVFNQLFGNVDPKYTGLGLLGHNGIDMGTVHGQPVYAAHDGVAYYEIDDQGGHGVVIRTNEMFDYNGGQAYFKSIYWHFCNEKLEPQFTSPIKTTDVNGPGQPVKAGDLIGYADSTGLSTGDHLHFGLKPMMNGEPNGTWYNVEQTNGYQGAIDPKPYLSEVYAQDINPKIKITPKISRNLYFGTSGADVTYLQQILNKEGFLAVQPTGFFGILTMTALMRFQAKHGISPALGFCGPVTQNFINSNY